ncbi:MAG: hypothetical protein WBQ73_00530 [Candidatus Babeliales bacterium]
MKTKTINVLNYHLLHTLSRGKLYIALFLAACIIRLCVFIFFTHHNYRYCQPDSNDYHLSAYALARTHSMYHPETKQPIFWRTPGYPLFLSLFYTLFPPPNSTFMAAHQAHFYSLLTQIIASSFIPIILFFLFLTLTQDYILSRNGAWIFVFHPGYILSSTYLLTESSAMIFLYGFYLCLYKSIGLSPRIRYFLYAGLLLGITTWIRPMGQFIIPAALLLIIVFGCYQKLNRWYAINIFLLSFALSVAPWYIRNYQLTHTWTFCPMIGTYLNAFSAPKILRAHTNIPLEQCWLHFQKKALSLLRKAKKTTPTPYILADKSCLQSALPIIIAHPFLFLKEWYLEVQKTCFDLYSAQYPALINNTFWHDPLEEHLLSKTYACLVKEPLPWWMRISAWLELIYALWLWIHIIGATITWLLIPYFFFKKNPETTALLPYQSLWYKTVPLAFYLMLMTGGFGYARLRLPVEPLLVLVALNYQKYRRRSFS